MARTVRRLDIAKCRESGAFADPLPLGAGDGARTRDIQLGSTQGPKLAEIRALTGLRRRFAGRASPEGLLSLSCEICVQYAPNCTSIFGPDSYGGHLRDDASTPTAALLRSRSRTAAAMELFSEATCTIDRSICNGTLRRGRVADRVTGTRSGPTASGQEGAMPVGRQTLPGAMRPTPACSAAPTVTIARETHEHVGHYHDNPGPIIPRQVRAVLSHLARHGRDIARRHPTAKKRLVWGR